MKNAFNPLSKIKEKIFSNETAIDPCNPITIETLEQFNEIKQKALKDKIIFHMLIFNISLSPCFFVPYYIDIDFNANIIVIKNPITLNITSKVSYISVETKESILINITGDVNKMMCESETEIYLKDKGRCWNIYNAKVIKGCNSSYFESYGTAHTYIKLMDNARSRILNSNPVVIEAMGTAYISFNGTCKGSLLLTDRSMATITQPINILAKSFSTINYAVCEPKDMKIIATDFCRIVPSDGEINPPQIELYDNAIFYYHGKPNISTIKSHNNSLIEMICERKEQTLKEYIDYNNIKSTPDGKLILYKMARLKAPNFIQSLYDPSFSYAVGETIEPSGDFDDDKEHNCSSGIHLAPMPWLMEQYYDTLDCELITLKCLVNPEDILVPNETDGKVRARKVYVDSIVDPLEELQEYFDKCLIDPEDILIPNETNEKICVCKTASSIVDPLEELQEYFD